jgi:hypothetical protein
MPRKIKSRIGWKSTPSPRPGGERVGVRGFGFETIGLLTPALSSFWGGEGEDNAVARFFDISQFQFI